MTWNPLRAFADAYVSHLQKLAQRHREKVQKLQHDASRNKEMVVRFDVFSSDVRERGILPQECYTYVFRMRADGTPEKLPIGTPTDARVFTDVPTLYGFSRGEYRMALRDGGTKTIRPFLPMDAVRLGLLETDGDVPALKQLFLLERKVLPSLAEELKLNIAPT